MKIGKRLAVDFDDVIHEYEKPYKPECCGNPIPGAIEFLEWACEKYEQVYILTARGASLEGINGVKAWLKSYGFDHLIVTNQKYDAEAFVDDKGVRFDGNFEKLKEFLTSDKVIKWSAKND